MILSAYVLVFDTFVGMYLYERFILISKLIKKQPPPPVQQVTPAGKPPASPQPVATPLPPLPVKPPSPSNKPPAPPTTPPTPPVMSKGKT